MVLFSFFHPFPFGDAFLHGQGHVLSAETKVGLKLVFVICNPSRLAKLVLDADPNQWCRAVLREYCSHSLAKSTDDTGVLHGNNGTGLFGGPDDDLVIQRFNGAHVNNPDVYTFLLQDIRCS